MLSVLLETLECMNYLFQSAITVSHFPYYAGYVYTIEIQLCAMKPDGHGRFLNRHFVVKVSQG